VLGAAIQRLLSTLEDDDIYQSPPIPLILFDERAIKPISDFMAHIDKSIRKPFPLSVIFFFHLPIHDDRLTLFFLLCFTFTCTLLNLTSILERNKPSYSYTQIFPSWNRARFPDSFDQVIFCRS
jgi:hypothetical protein